MLFAGWPMYYQLTDHFHVQSDLARTWAFFGAAENLPLITPRWLAFTINTPLPVDIRQDCVIDYTIRWAGLPVRWRTRIIDYSPPRQFIDLQIRGPYALWHHQHTFVAGEGGTICQDKVIYKLPGGPVGRAVHAAVVRNQLLGIFRYRRRIIGEHLGWGRAIQDDVTVAAIR